MTNYEVISEKTFTDANSNRKRITIDKDGKPVKITDSAEASANNFKPTQLKLDSSFFAAFK